ncbi:MAG: FAD:protein FMN transferase, partial [Cohnella sp.]|nr:FAD:protein FMN transferase [Cohnella sp.]
VANRAELFIDPIMKAIKLVPQSRLDLGGIVKSWTVKGLAAELRHRYRVVRGFINAGGDLTAWGSASGNGDPWVIGIENPWETKTELGAIALRAGSIATSSKLGRQWPTSRGTMHHLIDPSSMMPSDSEVVQCTVVGPDIVECEIWAKTLCISGVKNGLALMSRNAPRCEALLFTSDRRVHYYGREDSVGNIWHNVPIDEIYDKREI